MYKKILIGLVVFGMLTLLITACAIRDQASTANGPSVHMGQADFIQHTVTIKKGDSINLVDDATTQHIIKNGTWDGTTAKPLSESGAPSINMTFGGGDSAATPPFTTAGTFHIYCTIHPGMNLTVTVQ